MARAGRAGRLLAALFAAAFLSGPAVAQDKNSPEKQEPLAVIGGVPIYEEQLPGSEEAQLQRMMQQVFAVRRRALQTVLSQKLVEAEAKKKGVSVDELIKSEADAKAADPTDDQVTAYYQAHQSQINQPFDDAKAKVREGLKAQAVLKARQVYVEGLMQQALNDGQLLVLLTPPRIEITADPGRVRGSPKAPITIVEFSDFSCPFCRKAEANVAQVLAKYPGKVKLGYRDFPLRQVHPQAQLAAEASRCAGAQGKYWEYHDLLFANPPEKQDRDSLLDDARSLKLDDQKFDSCLNSGQFKPQIEQDIQLGTRSGVVGTPGFFINGIFLDGAQPVEAFARIIDTELAQSQKVPEK